MQAMINGQLELSFFESQASVAAVAAPCDTDNRHVLHVVEMGYWDISEELRLFRADLIMNLRDRESYHGTKVCQDDLAEESEMRAGVKLISNRIKQLESLH